MTEDDLTTLFLSNSQLSWFDTSFNMASNSVLFFGGTVKMTESFVRWTLGQVVASLERLNISYGTPVSSQKVTAFKEEDYSFNTHVLSRCLTMQSVPLSMLCNEDDVIYHETPSEPNGSQSQSWPFRYELKKLLLFSLTYSYSYGKQTNKLKNVTEISYLNLTIKCLHIY